MKNRIVFKWSLLIALSLFLTGVRTPLGAKDDVKRFDTCQKDEQLCHREFMRSACAKTINAYPFLRDQLQYEEYGQLFTQSARFQIGDQSKVEGRAAIIDALKARGPLAKTRHLNHIVKMEVIDAETVKAISYVNVHSGNPESLPHENSSALTPWVVGEYHDTLKMVGGECLIADRKVEIIFQRNK